MSTLSREAIAKIAGSVMDTGRCNLFMAKIDAACVAPVAEPMAKLLTTHEMGGIQRKLIDAGTYDYVTYGAAIERAVLVRAGAFLDAAQSAETAKRLERAEGALLRAGFQDLGGAEWKPPLGKSPVFIEVAASQIDAAPATARPELTVSYCSMPESNGKSNWTATLHRKCHAGIDAHTEGFCFARSECPDRVRYDADCMRFLIGETDVEPDLRNYDGAKHSGYVSTDATDPAQ